MKKRVIVTGGAGFIGSHLVDALVARRYVVRVLDSLISGKEERVNYPALFQKVDVQNMLRLIQEFNGADTVFHLAALPRVQYSLAHPLTTFAVNERGTQNVLVAAHEAGVRRVVFASSSSVYGNQALMPLGEWMRPSPISPYGTHKLNGENLCRTWHYAYGLQTVCLRFFNVYGPRFDPNGDYALVIGKFINQRLQGSPLTICGDGNQTRDFTHVSDVVRACIAAMESERVGAGDTLNIGCANPVSINRIAELVGGPTEHVPARQEPRHTHAAIERAGWRLGWYPHVRIEEGIGNLKKLHGLS